jgi:anti-sigma regulatory factor (Ser/Thr protein kinase)
VPTCLELEFAAIPEGVTTARAAITSLCERLQLADDVVMRVRIAVNEACINCVQHAYTGDAPNSTYMLETRVEDDALLVIVHDYGVGIVEGTPSASAGLGLGLRMIEGLADSTDISSRTGHGTRVAMRFVIPSSPT